MKNYGQYPSGNKASTIDLYHNEEFTLIYKFFCLNID
jgi:hypothetical protein